jgi:TolA-binding protein
MNKKIAAGAIIILIVTVSIATWLVNNQISELQSQNSKAQAQLSELQNQLNELQLQNHEQQDRLNDFTYGHEKENIAGNTTLTNLPYGEHNVTVYATDKAGNTGTSETIYFSVEEPFPTTMVITLAASMAVLGAGLAVYFKKRKQ